MSFHLIPKILKMRVGKGFIGGFNFLQQRDIGLRLDQPVGQCGKPCFYAVDIECGYFHADVFRCVVLNVMLRADRAVVLCLHRKTHTAAAGGTGVGIVDDKPRADYFLFKVNGRVL